MRPRRADKFPKRVNEALSRALTLTAHLSVGRSFPSLSMPMRLPCLAALRRSTPVAAAAPRFARTFLTSLPARRPASTSARAATAAAEVQIGQKNLVTGEIVGAVDIDVSQTTFSPPWDYPELATSQRCHRH